MYNHDLYESPEADFQNTPPSPDGNPALATASLVMGICALLLICCGGSIMLGALGILFALLSRSSKITGRAQTGLILSVVALVVSVFLYTFAIVSFVSSGQFQEFFENYQFYYDMTEEDGGYNDLFDDNYNDLFDDDYSTPSNDSTMEL